MTRQERDILKKALALCFENIKRRYQFIQDHQQEYPVKTMCRVLAVSESGYYAGANENLVCANGKMSD